MLRNVRRPTGDEVKSDAARILDELLQKRIDDDLKGPHKIGRNKTDPDDTSIKIVIDKSPGSGSNHVERSKTMPSKYRQPSHEHLHQSDLDNIERIEQKKDTEGDEGSESSVDDNVSISTEKRRKKSFFKRAKERLVHTFHRDQKEGIDSIGSGRDIEKEGKSPKSSPSKRRKLKVKQKDKEKGHVLSETHRHVDATVHVDKSVDYTIKVDHRNSKGSIHSEFHGKEKDPDRNSRSGSFLNNLIRGGGRGTVGKKSRKSSK